MTNQFKILVADDSAVYRKLVEQSLSAEDCTVLFAARGHEAIGIFEREEPALVITDWMMPDLTGIELCQRIRATGRLSYTYVIIITSQSEKDTDALTGLPNRRAVEEWAARQISGAARHGFALWLVMIDLDHFKHVNDMHGHEAGDTVLKGFAEILKKNTRLSNISARIGGEEFLQILTHENEETVRIAVDRIRAQFEEAQFCFGRAPSHYTASFGAAGFRGKEPPAFADLLSQADAALYRAKRLGRNRIEIDPIRVC